jgi:beta-phosphoglucomutase-like phosphatase (HAD superfamily)
MIKAVIFDMNGVIIDDEGVREMAFAETLKPFGISLSHHDYIECCAGKTDRSGYESILKKFNKSFVIDLLIQQKSKLYFTLFPNIRNRIRVSLN